MKVDPQRTYLSPAEIARVETVRSQKSGQAQGAQVSGDSVVLSGDLQLAEAAMKAAKESPDVRADEVARAKAMMERGEIGNDLEALAGKMLDELIPS